MLKNFIIIFFNLIFFLVLIILLIEYTNIFKSVWAPGYENKDAKYVYKSQGFSEDYWNKLSVEGSEVNISNYEDYYYVSPSLIENEYINIVDYYNSRKVNYISNLEDAKLKIWFFGGSTMLDLGVEDKLTIPSSVARRFFEEKKEVFIANFGTNGFNTTLERIKFIELLHKVSSQEIPDKVIFYHGVNDASYSYNYKSPYAMPHYMTKGIKIIVNQDHKGLILYGFERYFWRSAAVLSSVIQRLQKIIINEEKNFTKINTQKSDDQEIKKAVNYYVKNESIINSVCVEYKIKCYFILQPNLLTKSNPTEFEKLKLNGLSNDFKNWQKKYYQLIRESNKNYIFYDLSEIFNSNNKYSDYTDFIHLGPLSSKRIGNSIYDLIFNDKLN